MRPGEFLFTTLYPSGGVALMLSERATLYAIAEAFVEQHSPGGGSAEPVGCFLIDVRERMPDYLRLPFRILTLAFAAWPIPSKGRPYYRLPISERIAQIESWQNSRLEVRRRLIEFYASLALFGLYSDLYGQDYDRATIE